MQKVTVQPSGQQFEVQPGESVLAGALRQGVMLPYGCKNGACGSCKGRIVSGAVDYGHYHARVLTEAERAHGKALFCQAKPLGELVIECRTIGAAKDIEVVSTGSIGLDVALGVGGLPRGRVIEIYGPESSGKTTLTLHDHGLKEPERAIIKQDDVVLLTRGGKEAR